MMQKAGYFFMVAEDALSTGNQFYRITANTARVGIIADNSAVLAMLQQTSESVLIMAYRKNWAENYCYNSTRSVS
jgi:hypothetical protein